MVAKMQCKLCTQATRYTRFCAVESHRGVPVQIFAGILCECAKEIITQWKTNGVFRLDH